jgi:hypothetical protein
MTIRSLVSLTALAIAVAACGAGRRPDVSAADCPPGVPPALAPAPEQTLAFVRHAKGVQRYGCTQSDTGFAWTLVAPDADLFDRAGKPAGHHGAGPTWEDTDGSTVVGTKRAAAPVDTTAIPWLLVDATSHNDKRGVMTPITALQRVNTVGGLAPSSPCDAANASATTDVAYTADYLFYRARPDTPAKNIRCGAR